MGFSRIAVVAGIFAAGAALNAEPDFNRPWNPATPLPQFITHDFVDPANVTAIARYRSGTGHSFSDNYEKADRSLKNYFEPRRKFLGTRDALAVFAPANGTLASVTPEGHILSNGDHRGWQLSLAPDGFPAFDIRLFHVNLAAGLAAGSHVNAGDALGFADLREAVDFDWAVGAAWNALPLFGDPGQVLRAPGYRLLSPFDVMTNAAFANYATYGVTERDALVVPLAYRDAHPGTFGGQDLAHFDLVEFQMINPPEGPTILAQPVSQDANPGTPVSLTVNATFIFGPTPTYQWKKDGVPLSATVAGSKAPSLVFANVTAGDMGFYSATVSASGLSTESAVAVVTVNTGGPSRLINVSTRGLVPAGGALTPGFVLRGAGTKPLVIRAVGPTLATSFGVPGALADPKLDIIPQGGATVLLSNDNWISGTALESASATSGAFPLVAGSKDAAVLASLASAGTTGYSVRVSPSGGAVAGIALAEVYDPEPLTAPVRLANVSTLGFAGTDAEGLTPGFVIGGTAPKLVLIRAVGPGLVQFGVPGVLADPRLTLIPLGKNFSVTSNDDWGDGGQTALLQAAFTLAGAFALPVGSKDAALVLRLPPGGYTVPVAGAAGATGTVLVEVYDLDP